MKATGVRTIKKATGAVSTALTFSAELRFGKWLGGVRLSVFAVDMRWKIDQEGKRLIGNDLFYQHAFKRFLELCN